MNLGLILNFHLDFESLDSINFTCFPVKYIIESANENIPRLLCVLRPPLFLLSNIVIFQCSENRKVEFLNSWPYGLQFCLLTCALKVQSRGDSDAT